MPATQRIQCSLAPNVAAWVLQIDWGVGETDGLPSPRSAQTTAVADVEDLLDGVMVMVGRVHDAAHCQ